jgi:glycosyltransferase involved in cell wall biosynthesis
MTKPLVTIICVCYNQARFVVEALDSVVAQTYQPLELIVIDDGSTDGSPQVIKHWIASHPETVLLLNDSNIGYCKTFNKALKGAKGEFIMDFAADDVMIATKIADQVGLFEKLGSEYGVVFSDAIYINESGEFIREHFRYLFKQRLLKSIPQGDVYADVLGKYFIPAPSMLSRIEVLTKLGGYDEDLAYEDFDFWVRAAREFRFGYGDKQLIKIRQTEQSMSKGWYRKGDAQLHSTYKVCLKAIQLNSTHADWQAWLKRIRYELRQSVFSENFREADLFYSLLLERNEVKISDRILFFMGKLKLPLTPLRVAYHKVRFG